MKVLTEATLRAEFKNIIPSRYYVDAEALITPSARQYLKDKNVELIVKNKERKEEKIENDNKPSNSSNDKITPIYVSYYSGGTFEKKPEYMTQIYGNKLVYKDNNRIIFRGKLDSFQSQILELQVYVHSKKIDKLIKELDEILNFTRKILRAEVLNEELNEMRVLELDEQQLRDMSHNPKKYFGIDHILPNYKMGGIIIKLNSLRSSVREVEISAIKAFRKEEIQRLDIIKALNRLSSAIYIMMCKFKAGLYK
ncbi:cobalamin adenosyltransferase [Crassaminicella thermophila]|uniref:Cobalamin adenosyltransferase n=1 Tax=Crassaminicella thermophila TaxID=2599308 RepID=A0A5C0SDM0_CRATE|nr:cobalamin adenosyltransferase [Crassaminicella thermophila]QEK12643.1 cobalamin adenosyltransferase [Crassaminicella thermophila]